MRRKVEQYIRKYHMTEAGERVCIGLSGGADSVCLFLLLEELRHSLGFTLEAVHVNHCLRGAEADEDEEFVRNLCAACGVPCTVERVPVAALAAELGISVEEAGREARRDAFRRSGADRIALAHHMDDLAETMLHNMARGTSLAGLCSLRPVRENYIRPLLCVRCGEIEEYLRERGAAYRTDSTNLNQTYTRNKIRHGILPEMEKINANSVEHLCSLSGDALELEEYLKIQEERAAADCLQRNEEGVLLTDRILEQPPFLAKRVIALAAEEVCGGRRDISREHLEAVWELYGRQTGRYRKLPGGLRARRCYDGVQLWREGAGKKSVQPQELQLEDGTGAAFGNYLVRSRYLSRKEEQNLRNEYTKSQKCDKIQKYDKIWQILCLDSALQPPVLRTRRSGDFFIVNRQGGRKKLKEYLIESKVPAQQRDEIPLVCCGQEVFWIAGMRIGESARVTPESRRLLLVELIRHTAGISGT